MLGLLLLSCQTRSSKRAAADYAGVQTKDAFGVASTPIIPTHQNVDCKLYSRRYAILALFVVYSASNALQWIQYAIVSDHVMKYYGVGSFYVDCTSMIYMLTYIPLITPGSWFLDKYGIRESVIIGALGTCLGAWVKTFSLDPSRFWVTLLGQTIVACSQIFILNIPAQLAATWFGRAEVSTACSVGVFGNQVSIREATRNLRSNFVRQGRRTTIQANQAGSFVLSDCSIKDISPPPALSSRTHYPILISCHLKRPIQGIRESVIIGALGTCLGAWVKTFSLDPSRFWVTLLGQTIVACSQIFILNIPAQLAATWFGRAEVSTACSVGVFGNQKKKKGIKEKKVEEEKKGHFQDAGRIGLVIVLAGTLGSVISGIVLDKTGKYK
ncbi:uncharacterized MFS-type transporter C09D4.1-like [Diaphorina citri]|uniref:Uncharacterized MFS-type transporter C09D4.1-like n=1 Tax=Diaphorina citri TaxID=121845 RepID=A0A3Q0J6B3_DIACI|nr:uncharacterized MFS-type transporter C09D4.1-like [Diaphorina citri]